MHIMTTIPSQLPFPQAQLLLHELGGVDLKQVLRDVGAIARRHGALKPYRPRID
jgi:hypothetical protein